MVDIVECDYDLVSMIRLFSQARLFIVQHDHSSCKSIITILGVCNVIHVSRQNVETTCPLYVSMYAINIPNHPSSKKHVVRVGSGSCHTLAALTL